HNPRCLSRRTNRVPNRVPNQVRYPVHPARRYRCGMQQVIQWSLIGLGVTLLVYGAFVAVLVLAGRREAARAVADFVPACALLFARLVRDPRTPRRHRVLLALLPAYLASPVD